MEFTDVVMKRRAVRRFEEGGVDREVIERIARLAQRTPSAGFSQGQRLVVVTDPGRRREVARACGEEHYVDAFGPWISECAAQFIPCVSEEVYHRRYREADKLHDDGTEIEWPVPFWWVDVGATMQNVMLAAVNEGLGCGFAGGDPDELRGGPGHARRVHAHRRHARGPSRAGRPIAQPQARLGALRGLRTLGSLVGRDLSRAPAPGARTPAGRIDGRRVSHTPQHDDRAAHDLRGPIGSCRRIAPSTTAPAGTRNCDTVTRVGPDEPDRVEHEDVRDAGRERARVEDADDRGGRHRRAAATSPAPRPRTGAGTASRPATRPGRRLERVHAPHDPRAGDRVDRPQHRGAEREQVADQRRPQRQPAAGRHDHGDARRTR